jgi:hypothetical protein
MDKMKLSDLKQIWSKIERPPGKFTLPNIIYSNAISILALL